MQAEHESRQLSVMNDILINQALMELTKEILLNGGFKEKEAGKKPAVYVLNDFSFILGAPGAEGKTIILNTLKELQTSYFESTGEKLTITPEVIIESIIKQSLTDSFDELMIYFSNPERTPAAEAWVKIDGTKGENTYTFKYNFADLTSQYTDGTLNRELTRAKDRVLRESFS